MFAHGSGKATKPCTPAGLLGAQRRRSGRKRRWGVFNLTLEHKEFSAVTVGTSGGDSIAITLGVVIPIMTNAVDVKKGEDLLLQITSAKETKRKEGSWKDDVAKAANAPMAKAKAKTAPSLELPTEI